MTATQPALPTLSPLDIAFSDYHTANPHVADMLARLARQARARGRTRIGMKMLFEVVRWEHTLTTTGEFKLNNNLTSRYARLLMNEHPDLAGMFETRELHT